MEGFLDLPSSSPEILKILAGKSEPERLNMSYDQIRSVLEVLQGMH